MFEKLNNEQFLYILTILIEYKKLNPKKDVYLNEISFKEAKKYFLENKSLQNILN